MGTTLFVDGLVVAGAVVDTLSQIPEANSGGQEYVQAGVGDMGVDPIALRRLAEAAPWLLNPGDDFPEYNRGLYGSTPTGADRRAFGICPGQSLDHDPPLSVRHYWGDPATGERPLVFATPAARRASAADRSRMNVVPLAGQNRQGGMLSHLSRFWRQSWFRGRMR